MTYNNAASSRVKQILDQIEKDHDVEVLYAIESGSRAWDFASQNSDYDVRFIYREPAIRAFKLYPDRDVIEVMEQLSNHPDSVPVDVVGWSLAKALRLGLGSNPQFAEWSHIHTVYRVDPVFHHQMNEIASHSAPRVLAHHYRGLAKKTYHEYLNRDEDPVGKKYLYAIRPIMASLWMLQNPIIGVSPPVIFGDLRREVIVPDVINDEITTLLTWKMAQDEERGRRRFPQLDAWIAESIDELGVAVGKIPEHLIDPEVVERIWIANYPEIFRQVSEPGSPSFT